MTSPQTTSSALYRAYQFFVAVKANLPGWAGGDQGELTAEEQRLVALVLPTPAERALFARMTPNDQRHGLAVARTLQQLGPLQQQGRLQQAKDLSKIRALSQIRLEDQPALLQAALLHDVGKSMGQPIIHRVVIVLLEAFWPAALLWLARPAGLIVPTESAINQISWWRRPFVVHDQHPQLGARWTQAAGCDPLTIRLIARHQEPLPAEPLETEALLLTALQWADDQN